MRISRTVCTAPLLAAALACAPAAAQDYPNRPLRWIVAFSAGGAADLLARTLGQKLSERWNHQVVIDNRAGAGGVIGMQIAAKSPADGYTLLMGSSSNLAIGPALYADPTYDPVKSYDAVTDVANVPIIMVVHPSVPAKSIAELIQYAKARPGQLSYASSGAGATPHISGELFRRSAGIELTHVPYKGGGEAVAAVLGGHVQMSFGAVSTALPHMKAGKLRGLGVTSPKRLASAPDVPAIAEAIPGYEVVQWFGVFVPAGTPKPVIAKLNRELLAILALPEVKDRYAAQGVESQSSTPEAFGAYVKAEVVRWKKLLKEMDIRGEQVVR
ncbi:MAG: tripartite tricarboxylate transporter substrate binding protein [Burkholderiales bacterium]